MTGNPFFHHTPEQLSEDVWRTGCHYTEEDDDGTDRTWMIEVEWRMFSGRHDPQRVDIRGEGHPVRADSIRRLPLASIFTEMQRHAEEKLTVASRIAFTKPTWWFGDDPPDPDPDLQRAFKSEAAKFGAQRGRRLSPSLLEEVARIYRHAYANRRPVTEAVAQGTNCRPSTASKRIMAARKAGLLDDIPAEEARR